MKTKEPVERDTVGLDPNEWDEREESQEETQNTCLRQNVSPLSKIQYEQYIECNNPRKVTGIK